MRKIESLKILLTVIVILVLTLTFTLIGCKPEAVVVTETVIETVTETVTETVEVEVEVEVEVPAEEEAPLEGVLKVWGSESKEWFVNYYEAFEEIYPNVDVQYTIFPGGEEYRTQSLLALTAGDKPDVWDTNTGSILDQFIEGGGAMDITDIANERFYDVISESAWEFMTRDGKIYAAPYVGIYLWQVLFANKNFFEDNSIPYPKTMDEMIEIVPQIEAGGMQGIAWSNGAGWAGVIFLGDLVAQLADVDIVDKLNSGEVTWDNSPEVLTALQTLVKLAEGGAFASGYSIQNPDVSIQSWLAGKAALLYMGTWMYAEAMAGGLDFDVETIALPLASANASLKFVQNSPGGGLMINPDTEVPEIAIEFLDYVISPEWFKLWGKHEAVLTPNAEASAEAELVDWLKVEALTRQLDLPASDFWGPNFPAEIYEAMKSNISQALEGTITPEEALANIEKEHALIR